MLKRYDRTLNVLEAFSLAALVLAMLAGVGYLLLVFLVFIGALT